MKDLPLKAMYSLLLVLLMALAIEAQAFQVPGPLVDTQWLADNQDKVVLLDAREDTKSFSRKAKGGSHNIGGMQACGAKKGGGGTVFGHIPGSALVPWKEYAVKKKVGGFELHDMMPTKRDFEKLMQQSGVNQDSAVVITQRGEDAKNVGRGTRLYWTLKYFGHDNVALLDGGVAKWAAEKRKIEYGRTKPKKGNWEATAERRELLATLDDIKQASQDGVQLVDIRPPQFYHGLVLKKEKVARKGHIPGAKNLPFLVLVKSGEKGTTFFPANEMRQVVAALGIDAQAPVDTFCNTGFMASLGWFAMHELVGDDKARLYVGSMNEWSADPTRPVTTFKQE
jgi:thiosulfate/3-mercaptopyruvate sulfurtransferase